MENFNNQKDLLDHGRREIPRMTFGKRLEAFFADILIYIAMAFVGLILTLLLSFLLPSAAVLIPILLSICVLMNGILEAFKGQTLGKMYIGLIVANDDGTMASSGKLFYRFLIKHSGTILGLLVSLIGIQELSFVSSVISLIVFIGVFLALGARRQTLYDMIAGTAVYKKVDVV